MKPVSDFFPRLIPYLPGCPEPSAARALVDSAIAFCDESLAVRQLVDSLSCTPGVAAYEVDTPTGQQVSRVLKVWVDSRLIAPVAVGYAIPRAQTQGLPSAYYTTRADSELMLNLHVVPDKDYLLEVEVALRPVTEATSLETDLFNLWSEPVIMGAMARLMAVPNQPFSDPARSGALAMEALMLARKARIEGEIGRVKATFRVAPRLFT